ncbi:unnamed protein product [Trifolium pratense]|uniref:Uncharacterized protein n=1 Tax=Trifolium pratense TaxID=57577 RepID=A0ACB0LWG7_TRIPR|nr:unnamed protein product [Trifolium pratense]
MVENNNGSYVLKHNTPKPIAQILNSPKTLEGKGALEPSEEAVAESSSNLDAAETVHPEHEATNVEIQGNDVMREMEEEEEEMVQEGDEGSVVKVRRLARVNPYEGLPVPEEFSGGPLDTSVLYDYGAPHIARCVYDNKHMGSTREEAEHEVKTTKGAHARFVYLKELIKKHMSVVNKAEVDGDKDTFERYKGYITRAYLLLLVGTIIFSNKAKNNVDLTYLKYFIDLDQVHTYAWGTAALAFLYRELTNATIPSYKYVARYMTLLQTWIYNYFVDIRGSLDTQYEQQYPRATKYDPTKGQSSQMAMRKMMDQLLPHDITWTPYKDHRDVCPFKDITLYFDWIGCGPIKHWLNYTDRVLTYDMLGSRSTIPLDIAPGYMSWYFRISHPYIVCISTSLMQPMPVESDAAMLGILASIRYILNSVMHKDEVPNDSRVYNEFKYAYTLTFVPNQGGPGSSSQS